MYRCPVVTSTASAVSPSLSTNVPPAEEAGGVKLTWMEADALCPGASWKLLHTADDPLTTAVPTAAEAETGWTPAARWLVTVWEKSMECGPKLVAVMTMVQLAGTSATGTVAQLADCETRNGALGATTVNVACA